MNLEEAVKMFYHVSEDYEVFLSDETQNYMSDTQENQDDDDLQDSNTINHIMTGINSNNSKR